MNTPYVLIGMEYTFHSFPHLLEKRTWTKYEHMPPWTIARITPQMKRAYRSSKQPRCNCLHYVPLPRKRCAQVRAPMGILDVKAPRETIKLRQKHSNCVITARAAFSLSEARPSQRRLSLGCLLQSQDPRTFLFSRTFAPQEVRLGYCYRGRRPKRTGR
jgi:hypothetical protein